MSMESFNPPPESESLDSIEKIENDDLRYRMRLKKTMELIDSGSTLDIDLNEILTDLTLDANDVEKIKGDPVREKTRLMYKQAIEKVKAIMEGRVPVDVEYDVSDIDTNKIKEDVPHFDVLKEVERANELALKENPNHTADFEGVLLVWKLLPDDVKKIWNYKMLNPAFLVDPESLVAVTKSNRIDISSVPVPTKKVSIKQPQALVHLKIYRKA